MCDLTQFIVLTLIDNTTSGYFSQLFMENVALSFGIVVVIVIDTDSEFLSVFKDVCTILKIHFWLLARDNRKGDIIERYHQFLNKT